MLQLFECEHYSSQLFSSVSKKLFFSFFSKTRWLSFTCFALTLIYRKQRKYLHEYWQIIFRYTTRTASSLLMYTNIVNVMSIANVWFIVKILRWSSLHAQLCLWPQVSFCRLPPHLSVLEGYQLYTRSCADLSCQS